MRVGLEKVNGNYQGFAIDFRSGFQSGVMRMDFDNQVIFLLVKPIVDGVPQVPLMTG